MRVNRSWNWFIIINWSTCRPREIPVAMLITPRRVQIQVKDIERKFNKTTGTYSFVLSVLLSEYRKAQRGSVSVHPRTLAQLLAVNAFRNPPVQWLRSRTKLRQKQETWETLSRKRE